MCGILLVEEKKCTQLRVIQTQNHPHHFSNGLYFSTANCLKAFAHAKMLKQNYENYKRCKNHGLGLSVNKPKQESKTMKARFDGICIKCGKRIIGAETSPNESTSIIGWRRRGNTHGLNTVAWHVECSHQFDSIAVVRKIHASNVASLLYRLKNENKASVFELDTVSSPITVDPNPRVVPASPITVDIPDFNDYDGYDKDGYEPVDEPVVEPVVEPVKPEPVKPVDYINAPIPGQHHNFNQLVFNALNGIHSFLFGEAGSGKSYSARVLAELLGLVNYFIAFTPQTPVTTFSGYMDGFGKYVSTNVRHWVDNGGVMCMDECDNAFNPSLVWFNNGLASGEFNFPDSPLPVKMHKDCIVVAAANTPGLGPTKQYMDRRPIDESVRSRFAFIEWNTDSELEQAIALRTNVAIDAKPYVDKLAEQSKQHKDSNQDANVKVWVDYVQKVRAYTKENMPNLLITQRTTILGASMIRAGMKDADRLIDSLIIRGADRLTREKLVGNMGLPRFR
jgi:MoxR-like ATPase